MRTHPVILAITEHRIPLWGLNLTAALFAAVIVIGAVVLMRRRRR